MNLVTAAMTMNIDKEDPHKRDKRIRGIEKREVGEVCETQEHSKI